MTFVLHPARPIEVRTDEQGVPRHLRGDPLVGEVRVVHRWVAELDWWDRPVSREYWRVLLRGRLLCEIYRDRLEGGWFLERVYD